MSEYLPYSGIGSRKAPQEHLALFEELGYILALRGYTLRSGGAKGSDHAFHQGYLKAKRVHQEARCEIFLPDYHYRGLFDNPRHGIFNARKISTWEAAGRLALSARGGSHGLNEYGIALHVRNAYQVLGMNLMSPSKFLICSAPVVKRRKAVRGGTNTAVQLALAHHVPVWNLEDKHDLATIERFLAGDDVDLTIKVPVYEKPDDIVQIAEKLKREFQKRVPGKYPASGQTAA